MNAIQNSTVCAQPSFVFNALPAAAGDCFTETAAPDAGTYRFQPQIPIFNGPHPVPQPPILNGPAPVLQPPVLNGPRPFPHPPIFNGPHPTPRPPIMNPPIPFTTVG